MSGQRRLGPRIREKYKKINGQGITLGMRTLFGPLDFTMMNDAQNVDTCTAILFMARCLERIGDHIKNVAEDIYFIVSGKIYEKEAVSKGV